MMKTKIYAHMSKESLYDKGKEIGLSEDALAMFMHFNEVEIEIEIIKATGIVNKIKAVEI